MIAVFVAGNPAPQGSKRHVGRGIMIEMCKRLPDWRRDVRAALIDAQGQPIARFDAPVHLELEFILPRPKSAPKKSEPSAAKKPDLSKLLRAVEDAVTASCVWRDDAQVISVSMRKRVARIDETPGCRMEILSEFEHKLREDGLRDMLDLARMTG